MESEDSINERQYCDGPSGTKTYRHQVPMPLNGRVRHKPTHTQTRAMRLVELESRNYPNSPCEVVSIGGNCQSNLKEPEPCDKFDATP